MPPAGALRYGGAAINLLPDCTHPASTGSPHPSNGTHDVPALARGGDARGNADTTREGTGSRPPRLAWPVVLAR